MPASFSIIEAITTIWYGVTPSSCGVGPREVLRCAVLNSFEQAW